MKKFIKDYLKIISYTIMGLIFIVGSFYLVINYYHSEELKTSLYLTEGDLNYQNYKSKLSEINDNLELFRTKKNKNNNLTTLYTKLVSCRNLLDSAGSLSKIPTNTYLGPKDIYDLGSKFESNVLNGCYVTNLSYLTDQKLVPSEFASISPYLKHAVNSITNQVDFALTEIENNSSYFYTTSITSSTIRNYLSEDYRIIAKSYNDFASIILELTRTININASDSNVGGSENA